MHQEPDSIAASPTARVRVAIIGSEPILRLGLKMLLAEASDIEVIAELDDQRCNEGLLANGDTDILLFSPSAHNDSNRQLLQTVARLSCALPEAHIVVLDELVEETRALQLLRAGAWGYLGSRCTAQSLIGAIREVHAGSVALPRAIARNLLHRLSGEAVAS
jgi:DNA-binding NarL/FixJ family response regulator